MMTGWLVPLQDYFQQLAWTLRALGGAKKSFFFFFSCCVNDSWGGKESDRTETELN